MRFVCFSFLLYFTLQKQYLLYSIINLVFGCRIPLSRFELRCIRKQCHVICALIPNLTYCSHGSTKAFGRSSSNTHDNCYSAYYGCHVVSVIYFRPSGQSLSLNLKCVDVLYKRHVLGEPQRHLPTTLDGDNSSTKLLDSEKKDEKVSRSLKIYDITGRVR
jgi:hypothetical protein